MEHSYRCMIVDDEEMAIRVIANHLEQVQDFHVESQHTNPVEAFQQLDRQNIDVLFLDIQMPEITGMSLLEMLKHPPLTVFTTAYREYALDSYELNVVDYLLKPIGLKRFLQTISKLRERLSTTVEKNTRLPYQRMPPRNDLKPAEPRHLFLRADRTYQKIHFDDIFHIEAIRNHVKIVTEDAIIMSLMPISEVEKKLPVYFERIHRSFIVNVQKLNEFNTHQVGNEKASLPIGRTYRKQALAKLRNFLLNEENGKLRSGEER